MRRAEVVAQQHTDGVRVRRQVPPTTNGSAGFAAGGMLGKLILESWARRP